jgi:hypothetical protein
MENVLLELKIGRARRGEGGGGGVRKGGKSWSKSAEGWTSFVIETRMKMNRVRKSSSVEEQKDIF